MSNENEEIEETGEEAEESEGIGSKIKGIFWSSDGVEPAAKPTRPAAPKGPRPPTPRAPAAPPSTSAPVSFASAAAAVDEAMKAELEKQLQEPAKPAFSAFHMIEKSMRAAVADDGTRFNAALAVVGGQGHTLDAVITDVDECLELLASKEQSAESKINGQLERCGAGIDGEVANLDGQINAAQQELAALQAKIAELSTQREQRKGQKAAELAKIEGMRGALKATVSSIRQGYEIQKAKLLARKAAQ